MSTNPGVTSAPSASIVRAAEPSTRPTSVTTPPAIATSARRAGDPVPSTTLPPLMIRSWSLMSPPLRAPSLRRPDGGPPRSASYRFPEVIPPFKRSIRGGPMRELRWLRAAALVYALGLALHTADHFHRGLDVITPWVLW